VLDTTYFLVALIVRAKVPSNQVSLPAEPAAGTLIPSFRQSPGPVEVLDRVTMKFFVRGHCAMIAAPGQCDVAGIPKGSHFARERRRVAGVAGAGAVTAVGGR
jgi:hypothetical protein